MRFLIDTNVVISSEPTRRDEFEPTTEMALELARIAGGQHQLLIHPTIVEEIERDKDDERRQLRRHAVRRYLVLEDPPPLQRQLVSKLGAVASGSNHWYDHLLLAAVLGDAVHGLITQDDGIHRKAKRLGIDDRVHTLADALGMLASLGNQSLHDIPSVDERPLHSLDLSGDFFDSLRTDYANFDIWYRRVARGGRRALVVQGGADRLAAICIVKDDDDEDVGLSGRVVKVCTFKVADEYKGGRYGELLLKALFRRMGGRFDGVWASVYPHHIELIDLLERFGFHRLDDRDGEGRYVKQLRPRPGAPVPADPLAYHVAFGPPAVCVTTGQTFVVPIQPRYHQALFPDAPGEPPPLFAPRPHGNALRKAYLSHTKLRRAQPGATLLLYRSSDRQAVTAVGVLEDSLASTDPVEILNFVSSRTVYSEEEVVRMAGHGEVLAMLFRQDRFLEPAIDLHELISVQAVRRAPQTTITMRPEADEWLRQRLGA